MRSTLLLALLGAPALAHAAPGYVPIQGTLTDSAGLAIDGQVDVSFTLYSDSAGTLSLWSDTLTLDVIDGRFAAELGSGTALDLDTFASYPTVHLQIQVSGDSAMPLVPLDHVPYAAAANTATSADSLQGTTLADIRAEIPTATDIQAATFDTEAELTAVLNDNYLPAAYQPDWTTLQNIPAGFADNTDDVGYSSEADLTALLNDNYLPTSYAPAWSDLTGVPSGLDDGDDDTTYTAGPGLAANGNELYISEYAGGPLIPNPRFESGLTGWTTTSGSGVAVAVTDGHAGSTVYQNDALASPWLTSNARIAIRPGQNYRVSGAFKRIESVGNVGTVYLAVRLFDSSGANISGDGTWWYYPASGVTLEDQDWHTYSADFGPGFGRNFPDNAVTMTVGAILNYSGGNRTYQVTNLQIRAIDENARTQPQQVFWVEGGSASHTTTSWVDHAAGANGSVELAHGPFSWMFSLGGDWVNGSDESVYYRIELTNQDTGAISYLPDVDGYHRFIYITNNRLDEFTMHGVSQVAAGTYDAQLQVRLGSSGDYNWSGDSYGDMVFQVF